MANIFHHYPEKPEPNGDEKRIKAAQARERESKAEMAEIELARKRGGLLERREVQLSSIRWKSSCARHHACASQAVRDLRNLHLSHEVLFAIRMSLDKTLREALTKASKTRLGALSPRKAYAELRRGRAVTKEVDAAHRKKARKNARRRVVRKVAA